MGKTEKRNCSLDLIRTIAILLVVLNHVVEGIYSSLDLNFIASLPLKSSILCFTGFTLGRLGVPLFLMLSGYLLLNRDYEEKNINRFYLKNFLNLFIVWEVWVLIYQIYLCWYYKNPFEIWNYIKAALFLGYGGLPHTWYIPMILGMYLFIPFVSTALKRMDSKILCILLGITYVYVFCIHNINMFQNLLQVSNKWIVGNQLDLSYSGLGYGFYLTLGYIAAKYQKYILKKTYILFLGLTGILGFIFTIWIQIHFYSIGSPYSVWYNFFMLPVIAFAGFISILKIKNMERYSEVLAKLSGCSFGIFLIHYIVLQVFMKYFSFSYSRGVSLILDTMIVYCGSLFIVSLLSKVPWIKRIFMN